MQDISIGDRAFYYTAVQSSPVGGTFNLYFNSSLRQAAIRCWSNSKYVEQQLTCNFLKMEILILSNYKMPPNKMLPSEIAAMFCILKVSCVGHCDDDVRNSKLLVLSNCNCRRWK